MCPSRRTLLATLAAVGAGVAGCSARDESTPSRTATTTSTRASPPRSAESTAGRTEPSQTDRRTLSGVSGLRYFGGSVAASGSTAIVGADTTDTSDGAAATVFDRVGGSWSRTTQFTPPDVSPSFGRTPVAATDGAALVGPVAYTRTANSWRHQRLAPDGVSTDQSDQSVALDGDTAVVGNATDTGGEVYVFSRTGGEWTHKTTLTHPAGDDDAGFGRVVAVDGDRLVVAAPRADEMHVFDDGGHRTTLTPDGDRSFAASLAVSGDRLLVGIRGENSEGVSSGDAVVFEQRGDGWRRDARLTPTDDADSSDDTVGEWLGNYGRELALSGDTAVLSGAWSPTPQRQNGVELVAVFTRESGGWRRRRTIMSPATSAGGTLGPVALAPDTVFVGAPMEQDGGVVHLMDR